MAPTNKLQVTPQPRNLRKNLTSCPNLDKSTLKPKQGSKCLLCLAVDPSSIMSNVLGLVSKTPIGWMMLYYNCIILNIGHRQ